MVTRWAIGYHGPVKASRLLAGVLGIAMGLLPVAPPEHVHEAEEQGHVHAVIHRHLKPHGILEHHATLVLSPHPARRSVAG